jgi:hypothetical protein
MHCIDKTRGQAQDLPLPLYNIRYNQSIMYINRGDNKNE